MSDYTNDTDHLQKQQSFLVEKVFFDLENHNEGLDQDKNYFSESDFATILIRAEHYGIAIYKIEAYKDKMLVRTDNHEAYRKKATMPQWYKTAFGKFKRTHKNMLYRAEFKVSQKLLDRQ
ncbi:hypothetical protein [Nonlabens ponticola]|uniref:Uncharacterized protein n=1 Tax=Nonlabens ponticola TaxID=2496866 RepID=A0A3S9MYY9_9FLAO|nr:hypothetical protein [Nonlabens ponticola]AZQ44273.1 hypothetical protein EJ995_08495 [Nonlabens ponticola]